MTRMFFILTILLFVTDSSADEMRCSFPVACQAAFDRAVAAFGLDGIDSSDDYGSGSRIKAPENYYFHEIRDGELSARLIYTSCSEVIGIEIEKKQVNNPKPKCYFCAPPRPTRAVIALAEIDFTDRKCSGIRTRYHGTTFLPGACGYDGTPPCPVWKSQHPSMMRFYQGEMDEEVCRMGIETEHTPREFFEKVCRATYGEPGRPQALLGAVKFKGNAE